MLIAGKCWRVRYVYYLLYTYNISYIQEYSLSFTHAKILVINNTQVRYLRFIGKIHSQLPANTFACHFKFALQYQVSLQINLKQILQISMTFLIVKLKEYLEYKLLHLKIAMLTSGVIETRSQRTSEILKICCW